MIPYKIFNLVRDHFDGDTDKTYAWFQTPNGTLGGKPLDMIKKGREKKVIQYILSALDHKR